MVLLKIISSNSPNQFFRVVFFGFPGVLKSGEVKIQRDKKFFLEKNN
jgi:hypothetical protein